MGLTVIIIVALAIAFPLAVISAAEMYKRHLAFKERQLELLADQTAEKAAQYAAQVERLEERMRVLERISTDGGVNVARQIESLRDETALGITGTKGEPN